MNPGRCGWHDLERVWNADEQRWMCPHYSQAAKAEQESREIEASLARTDAFCRANPGSGVSS